MIGLDFFIPHADSQEQAERVYNVFLMNSPLYPLSDPDSRLFEVTFQHNGKDYVARVGCNIEEFPAFAGPVLAIIETTHLIYIHTQLRGGLSATPIYTPPETARGRLYFDDYPARSSPSATDN